MDRLAPPAQWHLGRGPSVDEQRAWLGFGFGFGFGFGLGLGLGLGLGNEQRARVPRQQPGQPREQRRLARARAAHERDVLPGLHRERERAERRPAALLVRGGLVASQLQQAGLRPLAGRPAVVAAAATAEQAALTLTLTPALTRRVRARGEVGRLLALVLDLG